MIAEDFRSVRTTLASRSPTESIAGLQSCEGQAPRAPRLKAPVEGVRARARARVYTGPKDPRGRGQRNSTVLPLPRGPDKMASLGAPLPAWR